MKELSDGIVFAEKISLLLSGNPFDMKDCEKKYATVEEICSNTVLCLQNQNLTKESGNDLERQAYSVNDGIKDEQIRNANIFIAV